MPFAYLDIDNPVCAWASYRGKLVLAPNELGFTSIWLTGIIRSGDIARYEREFALERVCASKYPQCISRLRCIFAFETRELASRAQSWDRNERSHFQPRYLAEIVAEDRSSVRQRYDANWISHSEDLNVDDPYWMERYWSGEAFPKASPHWESLYDGTLIVIDNDLRDRAHQVLKGEFPKSLVLLEFSRLAACIGSDLGLICPHIRREGNQCRLDYIINLVDAGSESLFEKMRAYSRGPNSINWQYIHSGLSWDECGRTPDLTPYGMSWPFLACNV